MLSNIKLNNFKSFKSLENLEIKPITILCGVNSCGKSSILQSLLLLKQTKESRNPNQSLLFNGKYVHLGDIENIIYGKNKNNELTLCYEYEFTTQQFYRNQYKKNRPSNRFLSRFLLSNETIKKKDIKHKIKLSISFKVSNKTKGYIRTADIKSYEVLVSNIDSDGNMVKAANVLIHKCENDYSLEWDKIPEPPHRKDSSYKSGKAEGLIVDFENLFPIIEVKTLLENEESLDRVPYEVLNFFRAFDDFIINVNEGITYVGPLREEPSRRYIYENEVLEIGIKGENAAYIYQTEQESILEKHYFLDEKEEGSFSLEESISLKDALSKWLDLMNIKGFKPDYQSEIIRLNMDANSSPSTNVNIADVGFGVSQIFPILLEGLRIPTNSTLLLEQPEIHLHPSLQMQMADYFISLALSNKNVIVETHSDHIINRLVRRIIEDENHQLQNMINIYFVSNSDKGAIVEKVVIDEQRGVMNWPDGFFDQTASEQEKIMMAGIKKRKAAREKV